MKLGKLTTVLILSLTLFSIEGICQCYTYIHSRDTTPQIPNEPEYWFTDNASITTLEGGNILIRVDTSHLKIDSIQPQILSNKNFGIYSIDSAYYQNVFIKNISFNKSYSMGCGKEEYAIALRNCYIRFYTEPNNKWKISVFDYKKSTVSFYDLTAREPLGYNDTCIFLTPSDFKFQKKKYRSGSIISLNENGIQIIKPVFKKHRSFDYNGFFFSNTYKVSKHFLYSVEKDCNTEDHISIKITYNDNDVDSFEVIQNYFSRPFIQVSSDTLICHSGNDYWGNSTNEIYKKYYKTNFIAEWNQSIWVDSFPILRDNLTSYYNSGDLLLLKVKCFSKNMKGLISIEEKLFTLNNVPLKPESKYYYLVLAFNIKTNKFIGYPTFEFTNIK